MKNKSSKYNKTVATVTFLNRAQIDYLDKLGKDSSFKYNHKLTRTKVLSEMVDFLIKISFNLEDINLNKESLSSGLIKTIEKMYCIKSLAKQDVGESIKATKDQNE